jgi:hypothetical protein
VTTAGTSCDPAEEARSAAAVLLEDRSNRLARALRRFAAAGPIAVVCCPDHAFDAEVATAAVLKVGGSSHRMDPTEVVPEVQAAPPRIVLACAEGAGAWRRAGLAGLMIADAPNELWWKVLEARESPACL